MWNWSWGVFRTSIWDWVNSSYIYRHCMGSRSAALCSFSWEPCWSLPYLLMEFFSFFFLLKKFSSLFVTSLHFSQLSRNYLLVRLLFTSSIEESEKLNLILKDYLCILKRMLDGERMKTKAAPQKRRESFCNESKVILESSHKLMCNK